MNSAPHMAGGTAGLILCGGKSSRMGGGDKCLLSIGGRTILAHVIHRIAPQVDALAISANGDPSRFGVVSLPVLADVLPDYQGPLAGILTGLRWAASRGCEAFVSAAGDTPFPPLDLVQRLREASPRSRVAVVIASSGGRDHPTFALWPVAIAVELEQFLTATDDRRVMNFLHSVGFIAVDFPIVTSGGEAIDPFFNVNRPEDLETARRIAQGDLA